MKHFKLRALIMLLIMTVSAYGFENPDSTNINKDNSIKFGFGVAFHDIYDTDMYSYEAPSFFFPIHFNKFIIEPNIRYTSSKFDDERWTRRTGSTSFGLGLFYKKMWPQTDIYGGFRVVRGNSLSETDYTDPSDDDRKEEVTYDVIKPTIGGQYYFSKHFSLGVDLSFTRIVRKYQDNGGGYYPNYDEYKSFNTKTKIIFRFYL